MPVVVPHPARHVLGRLAERRATGALHGPDGVVYLLDGAVQHVESPGAPGLEVLLTACGRLSPDDWREALRSAGPDRGVGRHLVESGRLTWGELELCHLGALYDAAFFALSRLAGDRAGGAGEGTDGFEPGVVHWLGPVRPVPVPTLLRETERRKALLDHLSAWARLDAAAVIPHPRPDGTRPAPSPGQRLLLAAADGRRTPRDMARLLGRSAYATVLDVRRLAAAGLVAVPAAPATPPPPAVPPTPPPPAVPPAPTFAPAPADTGAAHARAAPTQPAPTGEVPPASSPRRRLPRRRPGANLPREVAARLSETAPAVPRPEAVDRPDPGVSLLIRLRNALEARL